MALPRKVDSAENLSGLKSGTEATAQHYSALFIVLSSAGGRGAFQGRRSSVARQSGALGRENAGTSNHKSGEKPGHRKSEVSVAMAINHGLGGPKAIPCFDVGKSMDSWLIFQPLNISLDGGTEDISNSELLDSHCLY